jgi:hypothetical protein
VIESAGGTVFDGMMTSQPASIDAIADHLHARRNPVREMRLNGQWVLDRAREVQADAVVCWLIEEDEALPWEIARQMRSLQAARMPALLLSRQAWRATDEVLARVKGFVTALEVLS